MAKNHLKTIAAPKLWKVERKEKKFIARSAPGREMRSSVPLLVALRDMLKVIKTKTEGKKVLLSKTIIVAGKKRVALDYPVGLLDVLTIKETKENFRMSLSDKGFLHFVPVKDDEAGVIALKIIGKTKVAGKTQLNLFSGMNITVDKDSYKTGDSVLVDVAGCKIKETLALEKGAKVLVVAGRSIGKRGEVESVIGKKVKIKAGNEAVETTVEKVFVIGHGKTGITI